MKNTKRQVNYIAELKDSKLEDEFFNDDMNNSKKHLKLLLIILIIFNFVFLITDFLFIDNKSSKIFMIAFKLVYSLFVIILYMYIDKINNIKLARILTIYEMVAILIVLYTWKAFNNEDYLVQVLGVIFFILIIFVVPNRWIYANLVSFITCIAFIVKSIFVSPNVPINHMITAIFHVIASTSLCSVLSFCMHVSKRLQYYTQKQLEKLTITDHLTGIFNRAKINEVLCNLDALNIEDKINMSIAIFDYDDFKGVNDKHGHIIGDKIIIEITKLINENIDERFIFARWGGEEFVIIMPRTPLDEAVEKVEKIRKLISEMHFHDVGKITCSFGVVQCREDDDYESILNRADRKLYEAKTQGKNVIRY